ncbi:MAG: hypothetical protein ABSF60_09130 [Verrucomicrobiota bacterium]
MKPVFNQSGHCGLCGLGPFKVGFDSLQSCHAFAFHVALARPRQNRFGKKAMLHAKSLLDGFLQELVFSHGHIDKITNEFPIRKLKNPEPLKQRHVRALQPLGVLPSGGFAGQ